MSRVRSDTRAIAGAREAFLSDGESGAAQVRPVVADSWLRSAAAGVDAESGLAPVLLDRPALADYRSEHLLARVFPLLYDVLGRAAEDCDALMAVGDADGQLLWVCGPRPLLHRAEQINFVEGAAWDEGRAGTNAPGTALRLDAPVMIHAAEHFNRRVHPWSCAAAPIHDPSTQAVLGLVDITGGGEVATPQSVGLVRAAARMAEAELARLMLLESHRATAMLTTSGGSAGGRTIRVHALGRPDCLVDLGDRRLRLSVRHSEILVCLAQAPAGLTGEELEAQVYPAGVTGSTVRAELNRLRGLLGEATLASRPYRLTVQVASDWESVTAELAAGRLTAAVRGYPGPLLPASEAPAVVELRERLASELRSAVLSSGSADLLVAWTRTRWGAGDLPMWQRQVELLPAGGALRALASGAVARLEAELGLGSPLRTPAARRRP